MSCTPEQLAANRRNASRSTGPKTEEGKARSRANSLKHGLTGEGIVIPEEDRAEVERRADEFEADYRPNTGPGRFLIRRAAMLSVRLDRSVQQEFSAVAQNVRDAPRLFDEARRAEVERLMNALMEDPAGSVRQLRQSPEGIEALLGSFQEVRANLLGTGEKPWDGHQGERLKRLMGRQPQMGDLSRVSLLCQGVYGNFSNLKPEDGGSLVGPERKAWARDQLAELIDQEIARLHGLRDKIDFEAIALDRAESADRALFDPSRTAERARKYEAATERNFFRTMKEYREVEDEVAEVVASAETEQPSEELASSFSGAFVRGTKVVRSVSTDAGRSVRPRSQCGRAASSQPERHFRQVVRLIFGRVWFTDQPSSHPD